MIVAVSLHDGRVVFDLNIRSRLELIDQVLRHRSRERRTTHEHDHSLRVPRKVHRGLSRTVSAAGIPVHSLTLTSSLRAPFALSRLVKLLRRQKPDILYS